MTRWAVAALVLGGCDSRTAASVPVDRPPDITPVQIEATYSVHDSMNAAGATAMYHGTNGEHWLIHAAGERIIVRDARTGGFVREIGRAGTGMGELRGATDIVVLGDSVALVVERDNARVQGFQLPAFTTVGTFGERVVERPAAIAAYQAGNAYAVFVADDTRSGIVRLSEFRLTVGKGELIAIHWRTFGDTSGAGMLRAPTWIAVDGPLRRLLVVDGSTPRTRVKVYGTDGRFNDQEVVMGAGTAGAITLSACSGDDRGYWIVAQARETNALFHVLDRQRLSKVGAFSTVSLQDAISLDASAPFGTFPAGTLTALTSGGTMSVLSWADIVKKIPGLGGCDR